MGKRQEVKQLEKSQAKESPGADSLQRNEKKKKRKKIQVQEEITKNQYLRAEEKKETHTYVNLNIKKASFWEQRGNVGQL